MFNLYDCMSYIELINDSQEYSKVVSYFISKIKNRMILVMTEDDFRSMKNREMNHSAFAKMINIAIDEYDTYDKKEDVIVFCLAIALGNIAKDHGWTSNYLLPEPMCKVANTIAKGQKQDINDSPTRSYSQGKPEYKNSFLQDIRSTINMMNCPIHEELEALCIMYACDICLSFKEQSGGILPQDWIQHIISQTCDVFVDNYNFDESAWSRCFDEACLLMEDPDNAKLVVDRYYGR